MDITIVQLIVAFQEGRIIFVVPGHHRDRCALHSSVVSADRALAAIVALKHALQLGMLLLQDLKRVTFIFFRWSTRYSFLATNVDLIALDLALELRYDLLRSEA